MVVSRGAATAEEGGDDHERAQRDDHVGEHVEDARVPGLRRHRVTVLLAQETTELRRTLEPNAQREQPETNHLQNVSDAQSVALPTCNAELGCKKVVVGTTSIRASKRRGAAARTAATQDLQVVENPHPDLHLGLHPKEDNAALFSPDSVVQN